MTFGVKSKIRKNEMKKGSARTGAKNQWPWDISSLLFRLTLYRLSYRWSVKGQIISECLFDFLNFPKKQPKFDKFVPQNLKCGQIIK